MGFFLPLLASPGLGPWKPFLLVQDGPQVRSAGPLHPNTGHHLGYTVTLDHAGGVGELPGR